MIAVIASLQLLAVNAAWDWYPEVVARLVSARADANPVGWNLLVTLVIVSTLVLLVTPYQIAHAIWNSMRHVHRGMAF
jgi:hypothetical protein